MRALAFRNQSVWHNAAEVYINSDLPRVTEYELIWF